MFLFHPINFLKFLVKSHRQLSYKKGSFELLPERERGRLGNGGRPIWLKFGTLSY